MDAPIPESAASPRRLFARVPLRGSTEERGARLVHFLAGRDPAVLFKHSPACFVSRRALAEVTDYAESRPDVTVILVDVLEERDLSRWIAAHWDIPHQSPQAIVFRRGRPGWHGSHRFVEAARLELETQRDEAAVAPPPG